MVTVIVILMRIADLVRPPSLALAREGGSSRRAREGGSERYKYVSRSGRYKYVSSKHA